MTLLQALHALGYTSPRWASPSGRVVFTNPASAGTQVASHTFHGGTDLLEHTSTGHWWADDDEVARERTAMADAFPAFRLVSAPEEPPAWQGTLDTGYGRFEIRVQHRKDHGLPHVIPLSPRRRGASRGGKFVRAPHLFDSGALCVAEVTDWDAHHDTAATVVAWAAHWHACYMMWFITGGRWPADGVALNA